MDAKIDVSTSGWCSMDSMGLAGSTSLELFFYYRFV